jgi:hypothetical protein
MSDESSKENRPPDLAESADPETPQDPGIPGQKVEGESEAGWEPATPGRGFPEDAEEDGERRREAEADDSLAPGSMPPSRDSEA